MENCSQMASSSGIVCSMLYIPVVSGSQQNHSKLKRLWRVGVWWLLQIVVPKIAHPVVIGVFTMSCCSRIQTTHGIWDNRLRFRTGGAMFQTLQQFNTRYCGTFWWCFCWMEPWVPNGTRLQIFFELHWVTAISAQSGNVRLVQFLDVHVPQISKRFTAHGDAVFKSPSPFPAKSNLSANGRLVGHLDLASRRCEDNGFCSQPVLIEDFEAIQNVSLHQKATKPNWVAPAVSCGTEGPACSATPWRPVFFASSRVDQKPRLPFWSSQLIHLAQITPVIHSEKCHPLVEAVKNSLNIKLLQKKT